MMNERTEENVPREPYHKNPRPLKKKAEGKFASVCLVEEFILCDNVNTRRVVIGP